MTYDDFKTRYHALYNGDFRGDPEPFHALEDQLARDVLASIGDGTCEHPRRAALMMTRGMDDLRYTRWYS